MQGKMKAYNFFWKKIMANNKIDGFLGDVFARKKKL
jgi:hypothetical protein